MKKVLLMALAALTIGTAAKAQKINNSGEFRYHASDIARNPFQNKTLQKSPKGFVSDWYGVMNMIEKSNVSASLKGYVDFLVHDSLNKFVDADGAIRYGSTVSVGQVLDPKDDLMQLTDNPENQLSRFNSYTMDSILFRYLYVRNVDSISDGMGGKKGVTDTVFIAYWKGNQIRRAAFTDGTKYAGPLNGWSFPTRMPAAYFDIDTVLLTSGANGIMDTTRANNTNGGFENSWSSKYASFAAPAGMTINASAAGTNLDLLVAYSWTFKSGVPTIVGTDTAVYCYEKDPTTAPAGMRRTNYFGYGLFLNEGATGWENQNFYNTALCGSKQSSYATVNGWNGYIAGQAFQNDRFVETYFHLVTDTSAGKPGVGFEDVDNINILGVYPNPAKGNATVSFELANHSDVVVSITDLMGKEVKSLNFAQTASGKFELPIELSNINTGVYMLTIKAGNSTKTQKLVIAE